MASDPPKVLISYSHGSTEHAERVFELANRLRGDGIDCTIDQYVLVPEQGWPHWMEQQIRESNFVLMVCTKTYYERVVGKASPGQRRGVRWEGRLIYGAIYQAEMVNTKFIPILFESDHLSHIPGLLRHTNYSDLSFEDGYEDLYRQLTNTPKVTKGDLGKMGSDLTSALKPVWAE
jgi:TIR domain-containing protein